VHKLARFVAALTLLLGACGGKRGMSGGEAGSDMTTSTTTGAGGDPVQPMCSPPANVDFAGAPASDLPPEWGCPCTRRPGPGNADSCSQGVGQTATGRIGPGGGTLVLTGQQGLSSGAGAELDVPAGALPADVLVSIVETNIPPPGSLLDYSPVYSFEPTDLTFAAPVTFKIPWGSTTPAPAGLTVFWGACNVSYRHVSDVTVGDTSVEGTTTSLGWAVVGIERGSSAASCP
jgi:hypothetical protein